MKPINIYSDASTQNHHHNSAHKLSNWRKKHLPTIAIFLLLGLIAAWAAFFFPAFMTFDGLNE
jgi:hypothetical protein